MDTRYTAAKSALRYVFDALLQFKDAGLVAASAAAQVSSADKIVDVGTGLFDGDMVIDISAIEIASNDERYDIVVQGSNSATFASVYVDLATMPVGALEVIPSDQDTAVGRVILPFRNELNNTYYRYLRIYTVVAGSIATGINFTAFASKRT